MRWGCDFATATEDSVSSISSRYAPVSADGYDQLYLTPSLVTAFCHSLMQESDVGSHHSLGQELEISLGCSVVFVKWLQALFLNGNAR